jgi:hypothetical protein
MALSEKVILDMMSGRKLYDENKILYEDVQYRNATTSVRPSNADFLLPGNLRIYWLLLYIDGPYNC